MTSSFTVPPPLARDMSRWQKPALMIGFLLLAVSVVGAFFNPGEFFRNYLMSYLFWEGLALGSVAVVMLQYLTGGAWGVVTRRLLESASRTLPWVALMFVPIAFGIPYLYNWAHADIVTNDPILLHRSAFMNPVWFIARAIAYFLIWIVLAHLVNKRSHEEDQRGDQSAWLARISAPGLILYVFTVTFSTIDWAESLEDHWFSTMWGFVFVAQQGITVICFAILCCVLLARREPMRTVFRSRHLHDLGKLLLVFVMLWAYFAFSQLLIVWEGNLPDEIPWFIPRMASSWGWIGGALIVFQFIVPFLLLLSRRLKRSPAGMLCVVGLLLLMRFVDLLWIIMPSSYHAGFHINWMTFTVPLAIGGIWVALFLRGLKRFPLMPIGAANLEAALQHGDR